jgi:hypothetical protein
VAFVTVDFGGSVSYGQLVARAGRSAFELPVESWHSAAFSTSISAGLRSFRSVQPWLSVVPAG